MNVEKFTNVDNKAIVADQKAEVLAAGGQWIEPEERARLEEEENARLVEEARVEQLKIDCEKKGLNFDEENAKFLASCSFLHHLVKRYLQPKVFPIVPK